MMPQLMHRSAADDVDAGEHGPPGDPGLAEMRAAICAVLFENPRDLDIRPLWTQGETGYFRVNWWTVEAVAPRIRRSAFISVARMQHGYQVREQRPRAAAPK